MEAQAKAWWKRGKVWALLGTAALSALLFHGLIWNLLTQVLLGVGVASALAPLCKLLERWMPRSIAVLLSQLALLLLAAALLTLLLPPLLEQIGLLAEQVQPLTLQLRTLAEDISARLSGMGLPDLLDENMWQRIGEYGGEALKGIAHQAGGLASGVSRLSIAMVLAYYFLRDREMFLHRAAMVVPLSYRRRALLAAAEMRREVGSYLRGQGLVSFSVGALTALGLLLIGMPAWLALGVWMMLFDLIPYFGPFLGAIPIFLFSLSGGLPRILWAMGVVVLAQQAENSIISPRVLGGYTGLHPVAVMLALSGGGALWGVWGMLFALPIVVAARGALRVLRYREEGARMPRMP